MRALSLIATAFCVPLAVAVGTMYALSFLNLSTPLLLFFGIPACILAGCIAGELVIRITEWLDPQPPAR